MPKTLLLAALLAAATARAQSPAPQPPDAGPAATWFTVIGGIDDLSVDTVEVDPVDRDGDLRTMRLRVNRATMRTSWEGRPFRSYTAKVVFECDRRQARFLTVTYYTQPAWQGEPEPTVDYTGTTRLMTFSGVTPNPTQRIVQAACSLASKR